MPLDTHMTVSIESCAHEILDETAILCLPRQIPDVEIPEANTSNPAEPGYMTGFEEGVPLTAFGWTGDRAVSPIVRNGITTTSSIWVRSSASEIKKNISGVVTNGRTSRARVYFAIDVQPGHGGGEQEYALFQMQSDAFAQRYLVEVWVNRSSIVGNHVLRLRGAGAGGSHPFGTIVLEDFVWYRLELTMYTDPAHSSMLQLFLEDSTTPLETLNDVGTGVGGGSDWVALGHTIDDVANNKIDFYFDDLLITPLELPGPGTVHTFNPIQAVESEWTPVNADTNLEAVQSVPDADFEGTAYTESATLNQQDLFYLSTAQVPDPQQYLVNYIHIQNRASNVINNPGPPQSETTLFFEDDFGNSYASRPYEIVVGGGIATYHHSFSGLYKISNDIYLPQLYTWPFGYKLSELGTVGMRVHDFYVNVDIKHV